MTRTVRDLIPRKALAATLAGALAMTSVAATPARGDNKEALAAAAFLGIVAAGIIASTRHGSTYPERPHLPPGVGRLGPLPAACRFEIWHGRDRGVWYERRCLVASYRHWPFLPDRCERRVELPRRHHDVIAYDAHCLTQVGHLRRGVGPSYDDSDGRRRDRDRRDRD